MAQPMQNILVGGGDKMFLRKNRIQKSENDEAIIRRKKRVAA